MENYQFIKQIGHGNYGEVWLVKCSRTRKKHVLKRIDLHQASKREQRAAHLEAKLLSTIKHPNIVTYLDCFHNSTGSLFIVMNYCECGDLYTCIKNQNGVHFEEKLIVHWFVQICLALKYLHDKNILHRNLKTRNIFLTKNKIIKVGDLGISKVLSITQEMTATLIETPYYISPEIFTGKSFSQKSDIWALGCCTYEIATLKHPYIAQDIHSLLQKIKREKLPAIPEMYSIELFEIISSMLNRNSERRPCVTKLLLNNYVRRYVLLILEDNATGNLESESPSESTVERCKSSSDLSLDVPNNGSCGTPQRSMSTSILRKNVTQEPKTSDIATKIKTNNLKSMIISVPDVNGNGDGNDNSQHRRTQRIIKNNHLSRRRAHPKMNRDTDLCENTSECSAKSDNDAKKYAKPKSNSIFCSSETSSDRNLINSSASINEQKMKGEISFQLLNNLAYTLYTARFENSVDNGCTGVAGNPSFESKYFYAHQSQSPKDYFPEKESALYAKKTSKNGNGNSKTGSRSKQSSVCTLPQIKYETKTGKISKSLEHVKNLPSVKAPTIVFEYHKEGNNGVI